MDLLSLKDSVRRDGIGERTRLLPMWLRFDSQTYKRSGSLSDSHVSHVG